MKKNISILLLVLLFCIPFAAPAAEIPEVRQLDRLTDRAGLLTDSEEASLLNQLDEISERQRCDVVIVTVNSLEGKSPTEYADDFFDYNGYGMGEYKDGILFLISMEERDWAISTHGYGITAFTDAGQEYLFGKIKSDLGNNDYSTAFVKFSTQCDEFITQAKNGEPYNSGNLPKEKPNFGDFLISLFCSLIFGVSVPGVMKAKMNTVQLKSAATEYVRKGSLNISGVGRMDNNSSLNFAGLRESLLYVTRSKVARVTKSSGTVGSSTHTSFSGRTHGGSSGKF
ncbi:MAG: TPM domain-containing protein [Dysgonamonadaceae bacterium]|nr:TPM domain-containing protein [Dysgonamonadaceae bacterium]